ncbi:FUSC family protein [Bradyrhizobium sp. Ash2021]|uniref:FUSC family protein n=1 Tax=Bradyrhizobium sp. Ash2021 TaxID=2954771 RepID=UPI0028166320|nr:FUSC family protein [Bradyrhizobium sp. Ash2021]WMT79635.1 FUSC family protein [Bradyrhizobium sp. Ash2021]
MPNVVDEPGCIDARSFPTRLGPLTSAVRAAGPPLLFGLRLWASVCLALYVAFWLQLDNAYWAGTSAALVCQPHLGASLRKGWFRMVGTLVGGVAIVVLTAWFPQSRAGFLIGLALWGAACALVATQLRNFAAYGAALAGYTAAIIASDELGAAGGTNGLAFTFAVTRVSEIWIGIVCGGIVLAGTDFGGAPRRLAALLGALSAQIASRFGSALTLAGSALSDMQPVRRELVRQVIALDPVIDQAIGESSRLHYHSRALRAAMDGLFEALAGWSAVVRRLARLPDDAARQEADAALNSVPLELRSAPSQGEAIPWLADPTGMRRLCEAAVRRLIAMPADTPSLRLLADQTARVLAGLAHLLDGLALLVADPARPRSRHRRVRLHVPDWLPAFFNASRAFITIGAVELFWIVTAWPNGALAITWTAISVILFAPRAEMAYAQAADFMTGTGLAVVCAAIFLFALLPNVESFTGLSVLMALYLIPVGALMAQPWRVSMFTPMAGNFVPLLAPANQMSYDTVQFYNAALAIVAGSGAAALSFRLLPPLSPALRSERLLALSLRDLRRLATVAVHRLGDDWEGRIYSRLAALSDQAEPLQRAQLLTALSVGTEIIHLRRIAPQLGLVSELDSALEALAQGNSVAATAGLTARDQRLALLRQGELQTSLAQRERGRVLVICDALVRHRCYFDAGAST